MRGQRRQRRMQPEHHAVQVHRQHPVLPLRVVVVLREPAAVADPGVQVHQVQPAVGLHGGGDQRQVVRLPRGVGTDEQPADFLGDGLAARLVDIRHDHVRPESAEVPRHRRADPARRTRDYHDLCHVLCPSAILKF